MKITYITNVRLPTPRAHGLQIMKSCEAFARQGVDVRLVTPALKRMPNESPFEYYGVEPAFRIHRTFVLEVVSLVRWLGDWVSYVQNISFSGPAVLFAWMRGWLGSDHVIYTRDMMTALVLTKLGFRPAIELHDYRSKRPKRSFRRIFQRARYIFVNSEGTLAALRHHYDIPESRVRVVPNGVDSDYFAINETKDEARERLELSKNVLLVGYVGALETVGKEKGVRMLLESFARVAADRDDVGLAIVGGPEQRVRQYRFLAEELGIEDRVLIPGQTPYRQVPLWLRALDIGVLPSPGGRHAETTSPVKLFEYMAAGKAILAADLPVFRTYLNEENAVFYEPGNIDALTEKLRSLIDDPDHLKQISEQALKDAQRHTWSARAQKVIDVLYV